MVPGLECRRVGTGEMVENWVPLAVPVFESSGPPHDPPQITLGRRMDFQSVIFIGSHLAGLSRA
ncbi:MAG: hypothetical protein JWM11_7246 [Planctomycetaceae bacterium]|nr:hypothetical protein [Planctomycetaceae bacterium]